MFRRKNCPFCVNRMQSSFFHIVLNHQSNMHVCMCAASLCSLGSRLCTSPARNKENPSNKVRRVAIEGLVHQRRCSSTVLVCRHRNVTENVEFLIQEKIRSLYKFISEKITATIVIVQISRITHQFLSKLKLKTISLFTRSI